MALNYTWKKIVDWIEGRGSTEEADALTAQMATSDATMQSEIVWLHAFQRIRTRVRFGHLSEATRQQLRVQFQQRNTAQKTATSRLSLTQAMHVWVAALISDSWGTPQVGVRRHDPRRDTRQVIYKTELAEVALNIRPRNQTGLLDLYCQIFVDTSTATACNPTCATLVLEKFTAQLIRYDRPHPSQTQVSEPGDFCFSNVQPGSYDLLLTGNDVEIILPSVALAL